MKEIFPNIPEIKFEGKESKNPFAFHYYNPDQIILGIFGKISFICIPLRYDIDIYKV